MSNPEFVSPAFPPRSRNGPSRVTPPKAHVYRAHLPPHPIQTPANFQNCVFQKQPQAPLTPCIRPHPLSAAASQLYFHLSLTHPLYYSQSHPQKCLCDHTILLKTLPWSPGLGSFHLRSSPSPHPTCQIAIIRYLKCCPPAPYFKPQLRCSSSVTPAFSPQYPFLPTLPLLCPSDPRVCKCVRTPSRRQHGRREVSCGETRAESFCAEPQQPNEAGELAAKRRNRWSREQLLQGRQPGPPNLYAPAGGCPTQGPAFPGLPVAPRPHSLPPSARPPSSLLCVSTNSTPCFRAFPPPEFSTLHTEGPLPASTRLPTLGDLTKPGGTGSDGWSSQVSPERWGGAGALPAPPRDLVTPGLEFDTGWRRRRRAGGCRGMELGPAPRQGPRAPPAAGPSGPSPLCHLGPEPHTRGRRLAAKTTLLAKRGTARCTVLGMSRLSFGG
ncbi:artemin isoform X1 [Sapajus apella]|uniref:Artemin isoform X1 n=1 Tax=Sapajus apella TaxID=9515 RepID=A0A6J3FC56_SAPAP|nr:artemin isoform X1 [Sapajus apella]